MFGAAFDDFVVAVGSFELTRYPRLDTCLDYKKDNSARVEPSLAIGDHFIYYFAPSVSWRIADYDVKSLIGC